MTVTLVNPRPEFVHRVRLHQPVGGSDEAVLAYRDVLAARVRLVTDSVTRIDTAGRGVTLASGDTRGYDDLIYAVGSHSAKPDVPGAAECAYPLPPWRRHGGCAPPSTPPGRRTRDGGRRRCHRH